MKLIINSDIMVSNGNHPEPNDGFTVEYADDYYGLNGIVLNSVLRTDSFLEYLVDGSIQKQFKGCYVAWYYDKKNKKIYITNDLLSKQSVYYYDKDGLILVNTSLFDLCADMRANGRTPRVNTDAVQYFCNHHVFHGNMTYENNTFFLTAYCYLVIDCEKKHLEVRKLPIPKMKTTEEITEDAATTMMEKIFTEACEMQWRKNEQFGTEQILTLSGGMDSRAVLLHMMKQHSGSHVKTYTYAQTGSADEAIAKNTAKDFGIDNVFIPLDNCEFVYQRDEILEANEGQMFYIGSTGAILMAKKTQRDTVGIVHTGLGGGEIMGDVCSTDGKDDWEKCSGLTKSQQENLDDIRRCLNFQKTTSRYFYTFSPFLYEDFFEYAMCLPVSMRTHRKLYIKWYKQFMNSDFPSAASHSLLMKAINKIRTNVYRILGKRNPTDMNPVQYWYDTQPKLREYIENTWKHDCELLSEQKGLLEMLEKYFNGTAIQKFAVLTITGTVQKMLGLAA